MKRKLIDSFKDICNCDRGVNPRTLEEVIVLAIEIAREGREGRKIETLSLSPIQKGRFVIRAV